MGHKWGTDDAVEIAIRNTSAGKDAPIFALRGFIDGEVQVAGDTGAPAEALAKAKEGVEYKVKVEGPTRWTAEWKVPLASLGIDPSRHKEFALNLSVRKTADDLWLQWRSTRGNTWWVDKAGVLKIGE
jgi:hypothetical protein